MLESIRKRISLYNSSGEQEINLLIPILTNMATIRQIIVIEQACLLNQLDNEI